MLSSGADTFLTRVAVALDDVALGNCCQVKSQRKRRLGSPKNALDGSRTSASGRAAHQGMHPLFLIPDDFAQPMHLELYTTLKVYRVRWRG